MRELPRLTIGPHLLVHYAFATREQVSQLGVTEYIARNEEISELIHGHVVRAHPLGVLFVSSGAVYLGDDLATNPYGVLKARDERWLLGLSSGVGQTGGSPAW